MPQLRPAATLLIGATCLGSGIALAAARQALVQLAPPLTPNSTTAQLEAARFRGINPQRRREAALLLSAQPQRSEQERKRLLLGQGWGHSPGCRGAQAIGPVAGAAAPLPAGARQR